MRKWILGAAALAVVIAIGAIRYWPFGDRPGAVTDEALKAGLSPTYFTAAGDDFFHDSSDPASPHMDNEVTLSKDADETRGRNMWLVWTGGNDRFWDVLTQYGFGTFDLLKTISSAPNLPYSRDNRFDWFGIINEPCFDKPKVPDQKHYGLWLDQRRAGPDCPPDPFADESKYPGVKIGARGKDGFPVGSYYGEPTGIVGLRLFPNPDFDENARKKWDAVRYYNDPKYYLQKDLVRPYRVGMACSFCHVGPSPIHPPADRENPKWSNLNSTVGAQYFWFDRVFVWNPDESNFILQLLHAYVPGTLDTSLVSTDSIVNPRTMNALYAVSRRLFQARPFGRELLTGGQLNNKQFNDFAGSPQAFNDLFEKPYVYTPRVLKDGSDSVGALGALNRVYLNIGLFSEEWLLHFRPFFTGFQRITPIRIADAEKNSVYWRATEQQTPYMAKFLIAAGLPDRLSALPQEEQAKYLTEDAATVDRGKIVFADTCARCHSSILPQPVVGMSNAGCNGPNYLNCWNAYWAWTKTGDFKQKMREIVQRTDFLDASKNYLSSEFRVPLTLLQTNACSALARNALKNNIWDNFSSQSYKDLPSVGEITVKDPFTGEDVKFTMPAGGRGYIRPPSLISLWSTAPFLQNNTVGEFHNDPSVQARMASFDTSIREMLWPEKRKYDDVLGDQGVLWIQRTRATSWIKVPAGFAPSWVQYLRAPINWMMPHTFTGDGDIQLGPVPKGTPVELLGNLDLLPEQPGVFSDISRGWKLLALAVRFRRDAAALPAKADDQTALRVFTPLGRQLYELGNCPDYEVNRGHYFGTNLFKEEAPLTDQQKEDLIAFLKRF